MRSLSSPSSERSCCRKRQLMSKMICMCRGSSFSIRLTGHFSSASGSTVWFVKANTCTDMGRLWNSASHPHVFSWLSEHGQILQHMLHCELLNRCHLLFINFCFSMLAHVQEHSSVPALRYTMIVPFSNAALEFHSSQAMCRSTDGQEPKLMVVIVPPLWSQVCSLLYTLHQLDRWWPKLGSTDIERQLSKSDRAVIGC